MEPVIPTTVQTQTLETAPQHRRVSRNFLIIAGVAALLVGVILFYQHKNRPVSPEEELQLLEQTSQPVTATPEERSVELNALKQQSRPITTTPKDRMRALQELQQ